MNMRTLTPEERRIKAERFYLVGKSMLERNPSDALRYIRGSALMGNPDALVHYGHHLIDTGFPKTGMNFIRVGKQRIEKDYTRALRHGHCRAFFLAPTSD